MAVIATFECRLQVTEQPRPSLAPPSDDDAVDSGALHHVQCVLGRPYIAVAEYRTIWQRIAQPPDRVPVGLTGIVLPGGATVQRNGGHTAVAGDPAGLQISQVVLVHSPAHLHRHRDVRLGCLAHGGGDDGFEQPGLPRQCRTAALAGDLGDGTAEVEVNVIGAVLVDQHAHRMAGGHRVN